MKISDIDLETYVVGDLHIGHDKILNFQPQRASALYNNGYTNHDEFIIDTFNSIVKPRDKVILLGDIAFKHIPETLRALNGDKLIILGNHDKPHTYVPYRELADLVTGVTVNHYGLNYSYLHEHDTKLSTAITNISLGDITIKVMFSHYPVNVADTYKYRVDTFLPKRMDINSTIFKQWNCDVCIHGHLHDFMPDDYDSKLNRNASLDMLAGYKPVTLETLLRIN